LFSDEELTRFFQILLQTDDDLRRKPDPRVHLEMGLLRLIHASRLAPLEELLAELKGGTPGIASPGTARAGSGALPTARQAAPATTAAAFETSPKTAGPNFAAATPARPEVNQQFPSVSSQDASPTSVEARTPNDSKELMRVSGISHEQVAEIKRAIQAQQKFLGELVEHSSGWELEGAELRIYFSPNNKMFAELMEGRDTLEKVRAVSSNVLGRAVRVCARLDSVAAAAAASGSQELRTQFERDPLVRSMLQRFGGKITEVRSRQEEK
jgi:DNA polymerase III gamma/tau subunit